VSEVAWALDLDDDRDGKIMWREVMNSETRIFASVQEKLRLSRGSVACALKSAGPIALTTHLDEPYLAISWRGVCDDAGALTIASTLDLGDATHRTLVSVATKDGAVAGVLVPNQSAWIEPAHPSSWRVFREFVGQGALHVWIGYDHIAFLLLLILPAVLVPTHKGWRAASATGPVFLDLTEIVSAFTVSHSITLTLATTDLVRLPPKPVEAAIAASIVIAGALNMFPRLARWRLPLAFGFGLVHGFGFANALHELGGSGGGLLPMLAGFNIGVELAQLSLVAAIVPILACLARRPFYAMRFMPAASLLIAFVGAGWLLERIS